jgi:hypothetical protein
VATALKWYNKVHKKEIQWQTQTKNKEH